MSIKLSGVTRKMWRRAMAGVLALGVAVLLPVSIMAADEVMLDGNLGTANVTAGDKSYAQAINAKYNELVKVQVQYRNTSDDKTGQKVRVKITLPDGAGKIQAVKATVGGDNTSALDKQVVVNLERDDASLQFIPGSAVWKHNAGSNDKPDYKEEKISDEVVSGSQGLDLGDVKAGNYSATVTILES